MISTTRSDDIHDFLTFLAQMAGDEAASKRAGANAARIERFKSLVRFPLPELYLGYLREFGEDDPFLHMADDGYPELKYLLGCYEDRTKTQIPANGILIAGEGLSGQRTLLYSTGPNATEPIVVRTSRGEIEDTLAQTFRNHLYGHAFLRGRWKRGPSFSLHQQDEQLVPAAIELAARLDFQPYWFSDHWRLYLERSDGASLLISRDGEDGIGVYGSSPNQKTRDEIRHHLVTLGLIDN